MVVSEALLVVALDGAGNCREAPKPRQEDCIPWGVFLPTALYSMVLTFRRNRLWRFSDSPHSLHHFLPPVASPEKCWGNKGIANPSFGFAVCRAFRPMLFLPLALSRLRGNHGQPASVKLNQSIRRPGPAARQRNLIRLKQKYTNHAQ